MITDQQREETESYMDYLRRTEDGEVQRESNYKFEDSYRRNKESIDKFSTGSKRDNRDDKGRFDLIPASVIKSLAKHYEEGGKKYGDKNWLKGQPLSRYLDSTLRHINNYQLGLLNEDHIISAIWNLIAIWETSRLIKNNQLPKELDDL